MPKHHQKNLDKYEFPAMRSLQQARARMREVTLNIMNVEKQLGDKRRQKNMSASEYENWYEKTKAAKIFMVAEKHYIKDWILERRRQLDAKRVGIWPHNDPRTMLQRVVIEGRKSLAGEENDLVAVLDLIDSYLQHDA